MFSRENYNLLEHLFLLFGLTTLQNASYFSFYMPFNDTTFSEVNLSHLNEKPAGKYGFLKVNPAGHLVFEKDSSEIRFIGGQFFYNDPPHNLSRIMAARFSKIGFNLWKWGAMELVWNENIFTENWEKKIDRFDYLFYQMKKHGIYCYAQIDEYGLVYPSLKYSEVRKYYGINQLDSFPLVGEITTKGIQYLLEPSLWKAQKKYWYDLFNHKNPYTGLKYKDDPAIIVVELTNENYLLKRWEYCSIKYEKWPPCFKNLLVKKWNNWLNLKYNSTYDLKKAWKGKDKEGLLKDEKLGSVKFFPVTIKDKNFTPQRKLDIAKFLYELQETYFDSCVTYLKSIGVKTLFIFGNRYTISLPNLLSASKGDIMDSHVYYNHPDIIGKNGRITNSNPFNINTTLITPVAATSIYGKPTSISETNWAFPNEHQYLFLPFLVSYSSFQNWDIIVLHAFCDRYTNKKNYIEQQLIFGNNPIIISQLPLATLIFRNKLINTDSITYLLKYENVWDNYTESYNNVFLTASNEKQASIDFIPLKYKFRKVLKDSSTEKTINLNWEINSEEYINTTEELIFHREKEIFVADNKDVKILSGKIGNKNFQLDGLNIKFGRTNKYGSVSLISLDGNPIKRSKKILLTAVSNVRNKGSVWEEVGKKFLEWGEGPVETNTLDCSISLKGNYKNTKIWALDPTGKRKEKVKNIQTSKDTLKFNINNSYKTIWYLISSE